MGIFKACTSRPVLAHRAEVTAESMPPEIPTANPLIPDW
jgi:hypothetical protein